LIKLLYKQIHLRSHELEELLFLLYLCSTKIDPPLQSFSGGAVFLKKCLVGLKKIKKSELKHLR
jgi:hypothetical protein